MLTSAAAGAPSVRASWAASAPPSLASAGRPISRAAAAEVINRFIMVVSLAANRGIARDRSNRRAIAKLQANLASSPPFRCPSRYGRAPDPYRPHTGRATSLLPIPDPLCFRSLTFHFATVQSYVLGVGSPPLKGGLEIMKRFLIASLLISGAAQAQIKVGVYGPFTGGSAGMGVSMRNGAVLAIEEINAAGGILGKKVIMVARDDEARNERGAQIMQELLEKENVVAVLGPINTGVADASSRYAEEKHVPLIINASAGAKVNELFAQYPQNYVFRIAAGDALQTEVIVREAVDGRKYTKVALLCDDTNYGQNGRAKMEKALEKRKIKPVYIGKFKIKDTDMTAQLPEAKAAGAQELLLYGIGPELAAIANSMNRIGWDGGMVGGRSP